MKSQNLGKIPRKSSIAIGDVPITYDVQTVAASLRELMGERLSACCTDVDLDFAAKDVNQALSASKLARIQIWRAVPGSDAHAFYFVDRTQGIESDLWHVRPEWMRTFEFEAGHVSTDAEHVAMSAS